MICSIALEQGLVPTISGVSLHSVLFVVQGLFI